jgi:O-antigen/teichoic acid export membrane protein
VAREVRGTHAGLIVFAGIATLNIGNALFHLIAARHLGPAEYAEVVSLLALASLVGLPLGALQILTARYVAADAAQGRRGAIAAVSRRILAVATAIAVVVTLALLVLSPPIRNVLEITGWWPVLLMAAITVPALPTPVLWGVAQGLQRFGTLSISMVSGTIVRLAIVVGLIGSGLTASGVIGATLVGSIVSLVLPLILLRGWLQRPPSRERAPRTTELGRAVVPIAIGTLAITSLTTADLIVAKIVLSDDGAGVYGGASLIGRLLLYVPATIATVLLPKVSSRVAADRGTDDILGASLAVTVIISLGMLAAFVALPTVVVGTSLGSQYDGAVPLVGLFGVAMTGFALLNILLTYHLGRGATSMSMLLFGGALVQLAGYAVFHESSYQLVTVSIVSSAMLLVLHELTITSGSRAAWRWLRVAVTTFSSRS